MFDTERFLNENEDIAHKLRTYARLLCEANGRTRMTGATDETEIYEDLVLGCLYALPFFTGVRSLIDVGTGGGLPGLVISLCCSEISTVLLDSVRKKITETASIAAGLGCESAYTVCERSEIFALTHREVYDAATARAVASAPVLAEYLSPFVRVGGKVVLYKGRTAPDELAPASKRWAELGLSEPELHRYDHRSKVYFIVVFNKIKKCPRTFPRRPGDALKRPWSTANCRDARRMT